MSLEVEKPPEILFTQVKKTRKIEHHIRLHHEHSRSECSLQVSFSPGLGRLLRGKERNFKAYVLVQTACQGSRLGVAISYLPSNKILAGGVVERRTGVSSSEHERIFATEHFSVRR